MLDAYTIRKIAPRLALAVIGVNLSIYLCVAAVDITSVVGGGIGDLLREPFHLSNAFKDVSIAGNAVNVTAGTAGAGTIVGFAGFAIAGAAGAGGTGLLGVLAGGAAALAGQAGIAIIGIMVIVAALAALVALAILATLVIRYGIILLLCIVSPIAIACSVLPGTEKYFKQWWDLFLKTLLVYPIIAVIFAMSDVLGATLLRAQAHSGQIISFISILVVLVAVYAPLFMIPFAFKYSGGLIGGFYDFANKQMYGRAKPKIDKWKEDPESWWAQGKAQRKDDRFERGATFKQFGSGAMAGLGALRRGEGRRGFRNAYSTQSEAIANKKAIAAKERASKSEAAKLLEKDADMAEAYTQAYEGNNFSQANLERILMDQDKNRFGNGSADDTREQIRNRQMRARQIKDFKAGVGGQAGALFAADEGSKSTIWQRKEGVVGQYRQAKRGVGDSQGLREYAYNLTKANQKAAGLGLTGFHSSSDQPGWSAELDKAYEARERGAITEAQLSSAKLEYEKKVIDSAVKKTSPGQKASWDSSTFRFLNERLNSRATDLRRIDPSLSEAGARRAAISEEASPFLSKIQEAYAMPDGEDKSHALQAGYADMNRLQQAFSYMSPEIGDSFGDFAMSQQIKNAAGQVISTIPDRVTVTIGHNADGSPITQDRMVAKPANIRQVVEAYRTNRIADNGIFLDRSSQVYDATRNPDGSFRGVP